MKYYLLLFTYTSLLFAGASISPVVMPEKLDAKKVVLGEKLFFDTRLSGDNTIACASCHILSEGGDDNMQFSLGIKGQQGNMNAPTVLNAVYNFRQFWDGRAKDLQEQALGPIENPMEMGSHFPTLIKKLQKTEYAKLFQDIYGEKISKKSITNAIAEYEKTLVTQNAPFDRYLKGDKNAITEEQKEGYELFKSKGCISCHNGINVGGNLYSKFGVMENAKINALGRYNVTKRERDKYYFKVPSLRNIALTAPYFHDGKTSSLKEAIKMMSQLQLGRDFSESDIEKIEAFLHSLTGELPKERKIYVP